VRGWRIGAMRAATLVGLVAMGLGWVAVAAEEGGWELLSDDLGKWVKADGKAVEEGWEVVEGDVIYRSAKGGDIFTAESYGDFELSFEWKVAPGANSGVKYRMVRHGGSLLGPEYQVLDDEKHPDGKNGPIRQSASLYDIKGPVEGRVLRPVGEWNEGKIVAKGTRFEHWLNGELVMEIDTASDEWVELHGKSKFKGTEGFGKNSEGQIMLQDHGDAVWFRAVRVRGF